MTLEDRIAKLELQASGAETERITTSVRSDTESQTATASFAGWTWLGSPLSVTTSTSTGGWDDFDLSAEVPAGASSVLLTVRGNTPAVSGASEATIKARVSSGEIEVILRNTTPSDVAGDDHTVQAIAPVSSGSFQLEIDGDWATVAISVVAYQ